MMGDNSLTFDLPESLNDFVKYVIGENVTEYEPYAYIGRASEEQPVWCLFVAYKDSNGKRYCGGHYSLKFTDMEGLFELFNQFAKENRKVIVDTKGYFESDF